MTCAACSAPRVIPHVVITVLMLVAMADMLAGVFLRYVMTKVSATFDLPSIRFFWVEEIGEWALAWLTFIGAAIGIRRGMHFSVQMVTDRFPPAPALAVFTAHYVLIAALRRGCIACFGWQVAELNSQSFSPGPRPQPPLALSLLGGRRRADRDLQPRHHRRRLARPLRAALAAPRSSVLFGAVAVAFVVARRACRCRSCSRSASPGSSALVPRQLLAPEAAVEPGGRLPELGAARHPDVRVRGEPDGALRHVVRAREPRARAGRLGPRRPRHVGGPRRVLLLRHLRLDHRRRLGHRRHADAADAARRLQAASTRPRWWPRRPRWASSCPPPSS